MDKDSDLNLEEGEVTDDECYTPLERPSNYSAAVQPAPVVVENNESEDEELKSSSDSNSDCDIKPKRPKLKPKLKTLPKDSSRKKYDVWCSSAQEDSLLENLVNCDVSQIDRSRSVETYITRNTNKRTSSDRRNNLLRPKKRTDFRKSHNNYVLIPRLILDLTHTVDDTVEDIAEDMANKLSEEKEGLIRSVVEIAGKTIAIQLFEETQRIEKDGGWMIMNNSRRRTPGGVFFFLVKGSSNLTDEQKHEIFNEDKLKLKQEIRTKKKIKMQIMKQKIKAEGAKLLPELLNRHRHKFDVKEHKKTLDADVKNPPPSPATDGLDNSPLRIEGLDTSDNTDRNIVNYEDDCLDIGTEMELF